MKFSTITKRRGLFNLNLCSAFESECYSVFYDETILFDNEIYLHNETNLFWEKFHCDIRILYSCFFAVPQGAKSGDPYPQWNCSFAPEIWKALWHKGFCKRKKHDSCNTNGIITIVLIWWRPQDLICIFFRWSERKLLCCRRPAGDKQMSTGHLYLDGFESVPYKK